MCIEVYGIDSPVIIEYAHERILFESCDQMIGEYTILIRNPGVAAISEFGLLYPRPLMAIDADSRLVLRNVENISGEVIDFARKQMAEAAALDNLPTRSWENGRLTMRVPNPNAPEVDIPQLSGRLTTKDFLFTVPKGFRARHVDLLNAVNEGFSAWTVRLVTPLPPLEGQWISLRIVVDGMGHKTIEQSRSGRHVFRSFAAPSCVRRTISEAFRAGEQTAYFRTADPENMDAYKSFLDIFGLRGKRQVSMLYYELSVAPGDPSLRMLRDCNYEGHLWMRSGSPVIVQEEVEEEGRIRQYQAPVFQWKSGTMLKQFQEQTPLSGENDLEFRLTFTLFGE